MYYFHKNGLHNAYISWKFNGIERKIIFILYVDLSLSRVKSKF